MCDVVMKVHHQAEAHIWVHPLTSVLSFGIVGVCNHTQDFEDAVDVTFHMSVPDETIKPTVVSVGVSSLLDLLMGNSIARLEHAAKVVGVRPESNELRLFSRDEENEGLQTQFKLHPADKGSFLLSTVSSGDSQVQWVSVRDGKLVVSDADGFGSDKFALHRVSSCYDDWVLQEVRTSKLVFVENDDALLRVKEGSGRDAPSFSFEYFLLLPFLVEVPVPVAT